MGIKERKLSTEELTELSGVAVGPPRSKKARLVSGYVGKVPLVWIQTAARLPGRTLHVAMAIWYHHRVEKSTEVALTPTKLRRFGVHRNTAIASLERLESAGLVSVVRAQGRSPRVTVRKLEEG